VRTKRWKRRDLVFMRPPYTLLEDFL
jgi:hypothetical protein